MKKTILTAILTIGASAFGAGLDCQLQGLYPKDGCGNCQAIDRLFSLSEGTKKETVDMGQLRADGLAAQRVVSYSITVDGAMTHYYLNILDKKTRQTSFSQMVYLETKKGVRANLGDSSGLYLSLICNPR